MSGGYAKQSMRWRGQPSADAKRPPLAGRGGSEMMFDGRWAWWETHRPVDQAVRRRAMTRAIAPARKASTATPVTFAAPLLPVGGSVPPDVGVTIVVDDPPPVAVVVV